MMPGVGLVDLTRERIGLPALTKARVNLTGVCTINISGTEKRNDPFVRSLISSLYIKS